MLQQMNTILLLLIFIGLAGVLLVVFFTLDKVNDIQTGKSAAKPRFNPADTFGGLSGKDLWDAMMGVPLRGINPKDIISLKPRYEVVLQKHMEILFEEGQHDGREGFSMPVRCERIVPTLRGDIESWMPHEYASGIYKIGYSLINEPYADNDILREHLDEIGDNIFSATGLPSHPLSRLLMPFKEEQELVPELPEEFPEEPVPEDTDSETNPEPMVSLPAPDDGQVQQDSPPESGAESANNVDGPAVTQEQDNLSAEATPSAQQAEAEPVVVKR